MHRSIFLRFVLAITLIAFAAPAFAGGPAGAFQTDGAAASWQAAADHAGVRLIVSGPGDIYIEQDFAAGEAPSLSVFDEAGQPLPDGVYAYQLQAAPKVGIAVRRQMEEARERGLTARESNLQAPRGWYHSGYFSIVDGAFVSPAGDEPAPEAAAEAREIAERQTIAQSLCVGFDCPASPTFSFSTILMMENNTRIKFDDTSTAGSYPRTDWQIAANSSTNGGASYLGFYDCGNDTQGNCGTDLVFAVEANAPSNALYVDNGGRVGLGTSTPSVELHVTNGDTPTLRLDQTTASGFAAQRWDVAGNETSFFVRDATNGSTLPFRIRPGAASNSLIIDTDNDVGIGILSPDDRLQVEVGSTNGGITINSNTDGNLPQLTLIEDSGTWRFRVNSGGHFVFTDATGGTSPFRIDQGSDTNLLQLDGSQVTVNGDLTVTGVKNFLHRDPVDPTRDLYYVALEGPEAGTYYRGTATTVDGEAVIELPEFFSRITEAKGMTVQFSSVGEKHDLYIVERSPERIVIREASGKDGAEFDFFVQGVRLGYGDYQVSRPASK